MIGILATLGALTTKAIAIVTSIAPKILPWIVEGAKKMISILGEKLPMIMDTVDSVTDVLDIIDRNKVNSEEIGKRSIEAEKKPDDFDDIQAYINYLQEDVSVEEKDNTESEKFAYKAIGGALLISGLEEKLKTNTTPDFWMEVTRNKLKSGEIIAVLEKYSEEKIPLDFVEYCKGELPYKEEKDRGDMLTEVFSSLNPKKSIDEIEDRIMNIENTTQNGKEIESYDI